MKLQTFDEIKTKYSNREEPLNIAIGLRPSGVIHLGNMASLGLAGLLANKINPVLSTVVTTICDLDMPDAADWDIKKNQYVKYFRDLPARSGQETLLDQAMRGIRGFTAGLEKELGVKFHFQNLSEVQRKPGFRKGLKKVLDARGTMQEILPKVGEDEALVYPICTSCNTSNPYFPKYRDGKLETSCNNPGCELYKQATSMDVLDTSRDLAVHFFIDPLRDKTVEPLADIHVFGGDYDEPHNNGPVSKIEKIMNITQIAAGETPDILIGPTFYAADRTKMSKSKNNGLSMENLQQHFGPEDYHKHVLRLLKYVVEKGYSHVDYAIVKEHLWHSAKK